MAMKRFIGMYILFQIVFLDFAVEGPFRDFQLLGRLFPFSVVAHERLADSLALGILEGGGLFLHILGFVGDNLALGLVDGFALGGRDVYRYGRGNGEREPWSGPRSPIGARG